MDNLINVNLRGFEFKFKTKAGVFSKQGIDSGTKLLIDNMEIEDDTVIADLGCGTGVLGIVAGKLNRSVHVHLLDDHLRVVDLAKENVDLNKLRNVEVFLSDVFSAVSERTYHLILSNPPQHLGNEFLEEIANTCLNHLKPNGRLYWVMQNHLKSFTLKLFQKYFKKVKIIARGREHFAIEAHIDS